MVHRIPLFALALGASAPASAQVAVSVPRAAAPMRLDGRLTEPMWNGQSAFRAVMHVPTFEAEPSEPTTFYLTYDDEYLYFGCRATDRDVAGIRATSLRRDVGAFSNDWCVISLDTFDDKENALMFGTNPAGVRTELAVRDDAEAPLNFTWNTFWDNAAARSADGWSAEVRIPWSSLRFDDRDGRVTMGVIMWRRIARKNEMITSPAISPRWGFVSPFKPSQSLEVSFEGVRSRRPLYVTPYGLGGWGRTHALDDAETAYLADDERVTEAGLDVKYGLTTNLTADLTLNTDFAQVEADDQQVNLTRFSLFFPERRLFFQERASVFEYSLGGLDRLFYSRRIGLVSGRPVRIYGGGRIVGRAGGWDIGALDMQTGTEGTNPGENFGVVRLRRRFLNANSYAGGIFTSRIGPDGAYNMAYGLDAIVRAVGQDYVTLNWSQTHDDGDPLGVGPLDRSFVRARWERRGIDGLTYVADVSRAGGAFEPGIGFVSRTDYVRLGDRVAYGWRPGEASPLLRHTLGLDWFAFRRNGDGRIESASIDPGWELETKAGHIVGLGGSGAYEDLTSGFDLSDDAGVPAGAYRFASGRISYTSPNGFRLRRDAQLTAGSFYDGWRASGGAGFTWEPSRHLSATGRYRLDYVSFPERDQRFVAHVARLRTEALFSARLSAIAFVQYSSAADVVVANFRLRYNPREGNDLYVVYNEGRNTDRFAATPALPLVPERTLLVKYSYTWRFEMP